jgi:transportin-3
VESTVRVVKYSVKILKQRFNPFLIPFLTIVIKAYETNPISGFLYSVEFCIPEYSKYRESEHIFQEALQFMTQQTSTFLPTLASMENHPDLVYDFFGLCIRFLEEMEDVLYRSNSLEALLRLWMRGIGIEHREAVKTHSEFINRLIKSL